MRAFIYGATLSAALLGTAADVYAGNLNLTCKTELSTTSGTQMDFLRRYEISLETRQVAVYDQEGNTFTLQFTTTYMRADNNAVIIANTPTKYHEINRTTGMMFSFDNVSGQRRRGICNPS
jgi:hypothetical protein